MEKNTQNELTSIKFAGFWIRLPAFLFDAYISLIPSVLFLIPFSGALQKLGNNSRPVSAIVLWFFSCLYSVILTGRFGKTLGKMIMGIQIVDGLNFQKITYSKALLRYLTSIFSGLILGIGYIMVAFSRNKRALHDIRCNTFVIITKNENILIRLFKGLLLIISIFIISYLFTPLLRGIL